MKTLLTLGHGYTAQALAARLNGWRIIGTTRDEYRQDGVEYIEWSDVGAALKEATHVLITAAPDANGDPVLRDFGEQLGNHNWVGYLSTTGVYGDHDGGWVDEKTPLSPSTQRGKWRVAAEAAWQEMDLPLHTFRLAGIYGPNRGPFSKVRNGTARRIVKKNQVFSRIQVEDIATVLEASMNAPNSGAIYNVCDDNAAPPEDVIAYAAELLEMPVPEAVAFEDADMSPMARSFYAESKRVRNDLIKSELGVELAYPTYQVGLQALLKAEKGSA